MLKSKNYYFDESINWENFMFDLIYREFLAVGSCKFCVGINFFFGFFRMFIRVFVFDF